MSPVSQVDGHKSNKQDRSAFSLFASIPWSQCHNITKELFSLETKATKTICRVKDEKMASLFHMIPTGPLSESDKETKYGQALGQFESKPNRYDITMCQAPCQETACWAGSMICLCPVLIYMRHKALNHVKPESGWSNYKCCQGYFGGCCCIQPGSLGEDKAPCPCMCLEAFICTGPAVFSNSMIIRQHYGLGLDDDDIRLIRLNNCLQVAACLVTVFSYCTENDVDDKVAHILNCIADTVFCCMGGCMTAQMDREMRLREENGTAPTKQSMQR